VNPANLAIPTNMKPYTVAFLCPGPNYEALSDMKNPANFAIQAKHLEGIRANVQAGLQVVAAPIITKSDKVCAMAVYHPHVSIEQVTEILQRDPAIVAGRFTFEVQQAIFPSLDNVKMEY
jgi:hypothetical protein